MRWLYGTLAFGLALLGVPNRGTEALPEIAREKKTARIATASCATMLAIGIGYMADFHEPQQTELQDRKAELCERAFTVFVEQQEVKLGRRALKAGCDRDDLLVIAVSQGGAKNAEVAWRPRID